jgi:hypothetical protein
MPEVFPRGRDTILRALERAVPFADSSHSRRVARVPLAPAPVGLALSSDERHLFVVSEFDAKWRDRGVLSVVDVRSALRGGADAVRATTPAGCHPVRVLYDAAHRVVWVSARKSHGGAGVRRGAARRPSWRCPPAG